MSLSPAGSTHGRKPWPENPLLPIFRQRAFKYSTHRADIR